MTKITYKVEWRDTQTRWEWKKWADESYPSKAMAIKEYEYDLTQLKGIYRRFEFRVVRITTITTEEVC